jgi:menaquinone-dependent protoporphyrinogen IX oxidase
MRIAVVSAPAARKEPPDYVKALAKGMESMGHRVDIIDVWTEDGMKLPGYEYIAVVAEPVSVFSGKIQPNIAKILSAGSSVAGRKSAAFVKKTGLFTNRAIANLMKAMEKEGMVINWSDILFNGPHAEAIGKQIGA